jgi:hypothetical protein
VSWSSRGLRRLYGATRTAASSTYGGVYRCSSTTHEVQPRKPRPEGLQFPLRRLFRTRCGCGRRTRSGCWPSRRCCTAASRLPACGRAPTRGPSSWGRTCGRRRPAPQVYFCQLAQSTGAYASVTVVRTCRVLQWDGAPVPGLDGWMLLHQQLPLQPCVRQQAAAHGLMLTS